MITWRHVESSNVADIGWTKTTPHVPIMYVRYRNGHVYAYHGVSRQRAVAITRQASPGGYINRVIKPTFPSIIVPEL